MTDIGRCISLASNAILEAKLNSEQVCCPGEGRLQRGKKRKAAGKAKQPKNAPGVASSAYSPIDVSQVQPKSDILKAARLEVLSFGQGQKSREAISKLIKELGGQVSILAIV